MFGALPFLSGDGYQRNRAEKIRAMSSRARYRDFYDLFLILEKYRLNLNEIVGYIGRKEIRQPIAKANIKSNWSVIGTQKEMEMNQIFYLRQINDKEIEALIESLRLTRLINNYPENFQT